MAGDTLGASLPQTEPCYAFVALPHSNARNNGYEIGASAAVSYLKADANANPVFVYSCPSNSPIKNRMIYSSGSTTTYQAAKTLLGSLTPPVTLSTRKFETSDPKELDERYLKSELGLLSVDDNIGGASPPKAFAKPKGPPRRR